MRRLLLLLLLCLPLACYAQTNGAPPEAPAAEPELSFEEYEPRSTLVVPEHRLTRARYPFIDVHSHHRDAGTMSAAAAAEMVGAMDAMNMGVMVNLSGGSGEALAAGVKNLEALYPGRVVHFANVDFRGIDDPGWGDRAAAQLEADVRAGARGLKIFKNLGMFATDAAGRRIPTDDPRIDPVWAKAGELGIPVLIHTGDPAPFWQPQDRFNERWLELKERPERKRPAEPSWEQIMGEQWNVFRKHPRTVFVDAHLGWLGHDLARLGRLLDELPNVYTEVGAVLAELGRQPNTARKWLIQYQDRVLFGKDAWEPEEYHTYFRVFETDDDYIAYYRRRHAFWRLYGLNLPEEVLQKIYYRNALRIIPGLDRSRFPE